MSKFSKLSPNQINEIKSLYLSGKTPDQIKAITKVLHHIIRYHIERVQLSQVYNKQIDIIDYANDYEKVISDLKSKNKKLIEILTQMH